MIQYIQSSLPGCSAEWKRVKVWRGSRRYPAHWASVSSTVKGVYEASSAGRESACDAGDPGPIPGSGRSPGERTGLALQCSWASPVVQAVKNLPAIREPWVRSLGWEDALEEHMATHSGILAWRVPMDRGAWQAATHRVAQSQM